ncbi:hypothetical protein BDN67DRAFT_321878 [Paxillus ammoniavirescens]|nr:hypothetical protein BDN67DRAFT_321878 [Paxillus ammoniavirescens]
MNDVIRGTQVLVRIPLHPPCSGRLIQCSLQTPFISGRVKRHINPLQVDSVFTVSDSTTESAFHAKLYKPVSVNRLSSRRSLDNGGYDPSMEFGRSSCTRSENNKNHVTAQYFANVIHYQLPCHPLCCIAVDLPQQRTHMHHLHRQLDTNATTA